MSAQGTQPHPADALAVALEDPVLALRRRRRVSELSGLVVALVGFVATVLGWVSRHQLPPDLATTATTNLYVFGPLTLGIAAASWVALRAISSRWYEAASIARAGLDLVVCLAAAFVAPVSIRMATASIVLVAIVEAGVRFGRRGALFAWSASLVGYAAIALEQSISGAETQQGAQSTLAGFALVAALGFFVAWITGSQTKAFNEHLASVAAARDVLRHQATHDALTGLANRAVLYGAGADFTGPGALLVIDLDGFKAVNDRHGHAAGDQVLQAVAARLGETVGVGGLPVRVGGDEFVVVLPGADADGARRVAAGLRTALARPVPTAAGPLTVGASVGVALVTGPGTWDVDALTAEADARMYEAKAAGRMLSPR